jgi:hypothetical protein
LISKIEFNSKRPGLKSSWQHVATRVDDDMHTMLMKNKYCRPRKQLPRKPSQEERRSEEKRAFHKMRWLLSTGCCCLAILTLEIFASMVWLYTS